MISLFLAFAASTQAAPASPAPAVPAAVPGRSLKDLPGLTLTYHDLSESDVKSITKSLSKNKPLNPKQQQLLGASTKWTVGPSFTQLKKEGTCTVTKINDLGFTATADLPRFNSAWIKPADLPAWQNYLAATEAQAAAKLWFPYERLSRFEQAVIGKPCDQALKDGGAVLDQIKAEAAAFQPAIAATPAATPAQ